ncbi:zinc finger domain protein [Nannochloropsis oceanica]
MIIYPLLTLAFYLIASFYLPNAYLPLVLGLYSTLVFFSLFCWGYISLTDPAQPGGISCRCMKFTQGHSRYCASCRKSVPGLDHHCLWLNTCIGTRNYLFFFLLALAGTLQFGLQTLTSLLLLTLWFKPASSSTMTASAEEVSHAISRTVGKRLTFKAFMIVHTVAAALAFVSFASLCIFHGYLQSKGLGTYDWILRQRVIPPATTRPSGAAVESASVGTGNTAATRPIGGGRGGSSHINSNSNSNGGSSQPGASLPPPPSTSMATLTSEAATGAISDGEHVAVNVSPPFHLTSDERYFKAGKGGRKEEMVTNGPDAAATTTEIGGEGVQRRHDEEHGVRRE